MLRENSTNIKKILIVIGAAIGLGGGFSSLYFTTLSIFLKPLAEEFQWGRAQTSAATISSMVGVTLGAVFVGRLIDRIGSARVIAISVFIFSSLLFALSRMQGSFLEMTALSFGIGFFGVGTSALGYLAVLASWFEKRLGLALGAGMVGLALGAVAYPILSQNLISNLGWRDAYRTLSIIAVGQGFLAWSFLFLLVKQKSSAAKSLSDGKEKEGQSLLEVLKLGRYWALFAIIFIVACSGLGAAIHMSAVITDRGVLPELSARIVALAGVGLVLGRLVSGALMDLFPATKVASISFLLGGFGIGLIGIYPDAWLPVLGAGAFLGGFAIGAEGDFIPFIIRKYFGMKSFGAVYGTLYGANCLGGVIGPIAFGYCFDSLGSYKLALVVAALACSTAGFLVLYLGPYRYEEDESKVEEYSSELA